MFRLLSVAVLLLFVSTVSVAQEKTCVEFNGVQYCDSQTVIKVGDKVVPVSNPWDLLNSTKTSQVKKASLWDVYEYPPVIKELAKQVMMTEDELIAYLADADPAWAALAELVEIYGNTRSTLESKVDSYTIDRLFMVVLEDITKNIEEQLKQYDGVQV